MKIERVSSDVVEIRSKSNLVSKPEFFGRKFPEVFGIVDLSDVTDSGKGYICVRDHGFLLEKKLNKN